jgi:hypothetical protein
MKKRQDTETCLCGTLSIKERVQFFQYVWSNCVCRGVWLECVDSLGERRGREREREFIRNDIPVTGTRLQRRARKTVKVLRAASEVD